MSCSVKCGWVGRVNISELFGKMWVVRVNISELFGKMWVGG